MKTEDFDTEILSPGQIIAWNLVRARRSRGLTQDQAAENLEPYLGYRLSRAAFSQAERCLYGKLRRFDADEIVAFARAFELPIGYFFRPPQPHFQGKTVMVNGRPGNPKAHVTSPPLTRQQMLKLAHGSPDGQIKPVRRGRPPWVPPALAQVEAAAQGGQNMEQIARSLGIHPATLYRRKQNSPEFNETIGIGRQKRPLTKTALSETEVPVSPRAEELKLIQAMTAQERQEIDAICERARQRLSHPEVKATTQAVGQEAAMEQLKMPILGALESWFTPANNPKMPETAQDSMRTNANPAESYEERLRQVYISRQSQRVPPGLCCRRCGRQLALSEEHTLIDGAITWHKMCVPA